MILRATVTVRWDSRLLMWVVTCPAHGDETATTWIAAKGLLDYHRGRCG